MTIVSVFQSTFLQTVCVVSGALIGVLSSRIFHIGGVNPPMSLYETFPNATFPQYAARLLVGLFFVSLIFKQMQETSDLVFLRLRGGCLRSPSYETYYEEFNEVFI